MVVRALPLGAIRCLMRRRSRPEPAGRGWVEVATSLAFPDDDVLDEQADEGALLAQVEVIPAVGCHALEGRAVEVGVDGQLVEPPPRKQEASVDRVLRCEELRPVDPLRAIVRGEVGEELLVGLDRGDQLVGVSASSTSAGGCDVGVFERGEHVVDDDLLDVVGLHRVGAAAVAVRLVACDRPTRRTLAGLELLVHALADGGHH